MDGSPDIARSLYDEDLVAWANAQAVALRAGDHAAVDWANVIEEIEGVGKSERRSLQSALMRIMEHLIKLDHGVDQAPAAKWRASVRTQRDDAERVLEDNPSLRREVPTLIAREYPRAKGKALEGFAEHELERLDHYECVIPEECPYSVDTVLGN